MFSVRSASEDKVAMDFWNSKKDVWANTEKLSTFVGKSSDFECIFFPGFVDAFLLDSLSDIC